MSGQKAVAESILALAPCPFCGKAGGMAVGGEKRSYVYCPNCYAIGPDAGGLKQGIELWNRRADAPAQKRGRGNV